MGFYFFEWLLIMSATKQYFRIRQRSAKRDRCRDQVGGSVCGLEPVPFGRRQNFGLMSVIHSQRGFRRVSSYVGF